MTEDLRLSVSKTKCFNQCKKQFEFNYILKFPKKERDYHIFGKFCHRVLEYFHQQYIDGYILPYHTTMTDGFKIAWSEFKDKMTPEMKKECWIIVDQYLKEISKNKKNKLPGNVISAEKKFDFLIHENVVLNGAIDRIQLDDDGVLHVADYKTTKNKKYLKDDWFQLLTYAFVLVSQDSSLKKIRASYILLRHNFEYITTEFELDQIMSVKDKYVEYANQIINIKDYTANPNNLCPFCDYLDICKEGKEKVNQIKPSLIYGEVGW